MTELLATLNSARSADAPRQRLRGFAAVAFASALVLTGCSPEAEAPADPTGAAGDEVEVDDAPDADELTVLGSVTVDATTYDITQVRNCEPFEDEFIDSSLELQGIGESDSGERVQIDVYIQTISGAPLDVVAWSGPEGVFGTQQHADVQLVNERVSGSTVMVDAFTLEEELAIEYDLEVPNELIDCR